MNLNRWSDPLLFLQSLSHAHAFPQDQLPILERLFGILESNWQLFPLYSSNLSFYLRRNIEYGIKVMQTLDCLVYAQSLLTKQDRQRVSVLLDQRYKLFNGWQELKKLQSINRELVLGYLWVVSKVGQWRRVDCEEKEFREVDMAYLGQQLQELYTVSRYSFQQNHEVPAISPEEPLLGIYRASVQNNTLFLQFLNQQNCAIKLYSSLFYLSAHYLIPFSQTDFKAESFSLSNLQQSERKPLRGLKVTVFVIGQMMEWMHRDSQGPQKLILSGRDGLGVECSKSSKERKKILLEKVKAAATALIASRRSLDNQFRWLWFTKIVMDLLGLYPAQQRNLIQEIQTRAKQFANFLQLVHY